MIRLNDSELPPPDVIAAAEIVGRYFSERNVKAWALGPCAARGLHDELVDALRYMVANIGQPRSLETREGFANAEEILAKLPEGR